MGFTMGTAPVFWGLKTCPQWHTFSNMAIPPNTSQTVPPFFSGPLFPDISSLCHVDIKLDSTMAQAIRLRILYYLPLPSVLKDFHPFLPKSILECPKVLFLYHPCSFISQLEHSNLCWPHYGKQYLKWKPYHLSQGNKIADKGDRESYSISYGITAGTLSNTLSISKVEPLWPW